MCSKQTVPQGGLISKMKTKNELKDKQRCVYIYIYIYIYIYMEYNTNAIENKMMRRADS